MFTPVSNAVTATAAFHTDASWIDHDRDGCLDLFVATQADPFSGDSSRANDFFFRNLGDGRFQAWTTNEV